MVNEFARRRGEALLRPYVLFVPDIIPADENPNHFYY
jgi:hypothetical protein